MPLQNQPWGGIGPDPRTSGSPTYSGGGTQSFYESPGDPVEVPFDEHEWKDGYNRTTRDPDPYDPTRTAGTGGTPRDPRDGRIQPPVREPSDPTNPEPGEAARPGLEEEWRPDTGTIVTPRNSRTGEQSGKNGPVALWLLLLLALFYILKD